MRENNDEDSLLVEDILEHSDPTEEELIATTRLTRDLKRSAKLLNRKQAGWLVRMYYTMQTMRIRAAAQVREAEKEEEPNLFLSWTQDMYETLEKDIAGALKSYAENTVPGQWALSQKGIGPVIAAGLLAYIDIEQTSNPAKLWRLAGYDPTIKWLGGTKAQSIVTRVLKDYPTNEEGDITDEILVALHQATGWSSDMIRRFALKAGEGELSRSSLITGLSVRPWNAKLKVICWKAGQSFVKVSNRPDTVYGHLYVQRKLQEMERNVDHHFADQAARILKEKNIGKETEAYQAYSQGMLPKAHIQARAERWAVKMFLSHLWAVMYEVHHGKPAPRPYAIEHLAHTDYIVPPNWPLAQ